MNKRKINIPKEFLEEEYTKKEKSSAEIGNEFGCSPNTILKLLHLYGIKTRPTCRRRLKLDSGYVGELTIIKYIGSRKRDSVWECQCKCGKVFECTATSISNGQKTCWDCKVINLKQSVWKGYGEICGSYFSSIRLGAKYRKIEFSVTKEYLWNLFLKQDRKCALSGVKIYFNNNRTEQDASLDRIDSSKGYIEGNLQWIHKDINQMKWDSIQKDFLTHVKNIYEHLNLSENK